MKNKRLLVMITVSILFLVLVISVVCVRGFHIDPERVGSITVRNGLSGNLFEITERDSVLSMVEKVNGIGPILGFQTGAPGYVYALVFYAPDGSEVDRITLVSDNKVVIDNFTGNANVSNVLDYLSNIETSITK